MHFEVEFLPVGDASRAGDAIVIRYEGRYGFRIMVVDGGTDDSGAAIVAHIRAFYGVDSIVSDIVSTHPDTDHSCGLRTVLKELRVERLWVHGLWHHAADLVPLFENGRWTEAGLAKAIKGSYPVIAELMDLAAAQGTAIHEPFTGARIGPFTVLSPNRVIYQHLVPQFRKTPDPNTELLKARGIWLGAPKGVVAALEALFGSLTSWVPESWWGERLKEGGVTAAENESSVVMVGDFGTSMVLLTADAGVNALSWAADAAPQLGIDLSQIQMIQVPHHGSRRNVSPSVLDRLVGPVVAPGRGFYKIAVVSAPKDDSSHPRKLVLNAFTRRGAGVRTTQGTHYRFHSGTMPFRANEQEAQPLGFFDQVEDYG